MIQTPCASDNRRHTWWLRMLSFENAELLSKSQVFEEQVAARAKQSRNEYNQEPQQT